MGTNNSCPLLPLKPEKFDMDQIETKIDTPNVDPGIQTEMEGVKGDSISEEDKKKRPFIPQDPSLYPGFPDVSGLSEEESLKKIEEFWCYWRELKRAGKRPPIVPKDLSMYPGFPDVRCLDEEEKAKQINAFWVQWRKKKYKAKKLRKKLEEKANRPPNGKSFF